MGIGKPPCLFVFRSLAWLPAGGPGQEADDSVALVSRILPLMMLISTNIKPVKKRDEVEVSLFPVLLFLVCLLLLFVIDFYDAD